ncbi:MAG: hypothetical protein MI975_02010 [Cytophagales bacterium]|nr:hypothetical protein [Cytophagales bacterium]
MYTRKNYSFKDMVYWTRRDLYKFIVIAVVPVALYSLLDFKWLHLPWLPIALIGTAVAFIVGFKNNASYGRLWEARQIWGGIVNTSRAFGIMVNDFINNEHAKIRISEKELRAIRQKIIYRHIAWMTAHRYTLRVTKPWETFFKVLTNKEYAELYDVQEMRIPFEEAIKPYLDEQELKHIADKKNKAAQILALQSKNLRELKEKGLIWEFSFLEMENTLKELYTLQGKNERIKNFPYPRQFATLNHFFVWIFILLLPFGIMNEFDKIGAELLGQLGGMEYGTMKYCYEFIAKHFVWSSIPFSIIISWVFYTMERIGEVSENPFEGTANDVPITTMSRDIEIDLREMLGEPRDIIPAPIQMKYDIQT